MTSFRRIVTLAIGSLLCAVLAGLTALYASGKALPSSDGAYGWSLRRSLDNPFVFNTWLGLIAGGAILGFAVSLRTLRQVEMSTAIPVVVVTTVVAAAICGYVFVPLSPLAAIVAGIVAMHVCRRRQEHQVRRSES